MNELISKFGNSDEILNDFFEFYTAGGFGIKSKSEIDLYVFELILQDYKFLGFDKPIDIYSLNKAELNKLANKLKITLTKLLNLLEKYKLIRGQIIDKNNFVELLKVNLKNYQEDEIIKKGKLKLYIPNKIFKQEIEVKLSEISFIPDYSFNRDILVIDWLSVLYLLDISTSDFFNIIKTAKIEDNDDYKDFFNKYNSKSLNEVLSGFGKSLLKKYFGEGTDELIEIGKYIFNKLR